MIKKLERMYAIGLITLDEVYSHAKELFYWGKISREEYNNILDFCAESGLTQARIAYNKYREILCAIKHEDFDVRYFKLAYSWEGSTSAMWSYIGKKLKQVYLDDRLSHIRAHSRNDAQCRKVSDRILGGNLRAEWTRRNWARVGNREWIATQAEWDRKVEVYKGWI